MYRPNHCLDDHCKSPSSVLIAPLFACTNTVMCRPDYNEPSAPLLIFTVIAFTITEWPFDYIFMLLFSLKYWVCISPIIIEKEC